MILDFIIAVQRLTKDINNANKESYVANAALQAVKCNIQPATAEETALAEGIFGQTFVCYTTESGVMVGDKVTVSGTSEIYRIKGKEDWSMDPMPHYELTLVKMEEEEII